MHFSEGVDTACAADEDLTIVLGVEIDELFAIEASVLEAESTCETCLLVHRKESLQCRVLQGVGGDSCQHKRHTDTVVCAKGCALSFDEVAIDIGVDRVVVEVVHGVVVLLADHIHMRLEDNARFVFVARGSRFAHDDIACFIYGMFEVMLYGKRLEPFDNLAFALGWARHLGNLVEDGENLLWLQFLYHIY